MSLYYLYIKKTYVFFIKKKSKIIILNLLMKRINININILFDTHLCFINIYVVLQTKKYNLRYRYQTVFLAINWSVINLLIKNP